MQRIERLRRGGVLNVRGKLIDCVSSERKLHRAEKREERAARVDIFEPVAGLQDRSAACEHDVFGERRSVRHTDAKVFANAVADGGLEQYEFERLGALETKIVEIRKAFELGSDVKIRAGVH